MRKYVSCKKLRFIYFAIFDSFLSYCCLVWAQNHSTILRIVILCCWGYILTLQALNILKETPKPVGPFETMPHEPLHPGKGTKPDCVIQLS